MRRLIVILLLAASSAFAAHRDPAGYDRVLLPFSGFTSGVGGSWFAQWWFRNDGDTDVDVFPLARSCGFCPPAFRLSIVGAIPPHTTPMYFPGDVLPGPLVPLSIPVAASPPGVFLYLERGKAAQLAITGFLGRFTFSGSQRRSVSSALHAVPENRFRRGRQSIFVPLAAGSRYTLRVFALPESVDNAAVTVRSFTVPEIAGFPAIGGETLTATAVLDLTTPSSEGFRSGCAGECDVPHVAYKPAVAESAILNAPFQQVPLPTLMRIEIEPASPNVKWWAVVSATSASDDVQFFDTSDF